MGRYTLLVSHPELGEMSFPVAVNGTKEVTLIEMIDRIGQGLGKTTRWTLLQDLERTSVKVMPATKALEISPEGVVVETADGGRQEIPADTVVLGVGSQPYHPLANIVEKLKIPYTSVGDADQVATVFEAIHSGFRAGLAI